MELAEATRHADHAIGVLAPYCERIEVAGSVRRKAPTVGDIEIVCIPKSSPVVNLFGECESEVRDWRFGAGVDALGSKVRGDAHHGKAFCRLSDDGILFDIFTATPENWGYIFAIRTGSAAFSRFVLATGWNKAGYTGVDGRLVRDPEDPEGSAVVVREEKDLFDLIGLDFVAPERRTA